MQNSATKKHGGLIRNTWSGLYRHSNRTVVWIDTPIYKMPGYQFEFYGGLEVINYLETHRDERSHYLQKETILDVNVLMLTDLKILTLSNLVIEEKLKNKLPLLENTMNTNNQQELQNQSQELMTPSLPKKMTRWLVHIEEVEVEICKDENNKYYVRHNLYWYIIHNRKNPDPIHNCVIKNCEIMINNRLPTIWWVGYTFKFEELEFEDGLITEAVLLPLKMFEDLIKYHFAESTKNSTAEPPKSSDYFYQQYQLGKWLQNNSLGQFKK
ncbi:hypothetical protein [Crocosphaera chwakensis]|uniref:Uncharacterized protein n=1 Tax=Crocosphaera chwakensis CCY0110 TaxID=391612 RepID=A3IM13_9CHRO|nr:hypothetical protein [Crocosphaera chwakensis]EAZ92469.1 hypothetical protein CY0110_02049 [Crocosphaera chwakensis CCY0110]